MKILRPKRALWLSAIVLLACQTSSDRARIDTTHTLMSGSSTPQADSVRQTNPHSDIVVTAPWADTRQVMDTSLDAPNFQCAPSTVTPKDTITLRAEVPHGGWLAVSRPDSTLFMLIEPKMPAPDSALVDSEAFQNMLILRMRADIRWRPSVYGRAAESVFSVPGKYVFTIGQNLGTEYDYDEADHVDLDWHCTVQVAGSS